MMQLRKMYTEHSNAYVRMRLKRENTKKEIL